MTKRLRCKVRSLWARLHNQIWDGHCVCSTHCVCVDCGKDLRVR